MAKKYIEDPNHPNGGYMGYLSGKEALADYYAELESVNKDQNLSTAGYSVLAVFLTAVVIMSILAACFKW